MELPPNFDPQYLDYLGYGGWITTSDGGWVHYDVWRRNRERDEDYIRRVADAYAHARASAEER